MDILLSITDFVVNHPQVIIGFLVLAVLLKLLRVAIGVIFKICLAIAVAGLIYLFLTGQLPAITV